ncbi:MAG: hypothetical protein QNK37_00135 [Acidobacteriota bacterium]|nr:hypothetical protein [Acidobacteriota bacterium]
MVRSFPRDAETLPALVRAGPAGSGNVLPGVIIVTRFYQACFLENSVPLPTFSAYLSDFSVGIDPIQLKNIGDEKQANR